MSSLNKQDATRGQDTDGNLADDRLARRNALILSLAQALYGIASSLVIMIGGLTGHMLADDKSLATLPVSSMLLGTAIATVPASLFMQRFGRRPGFVVGALFGTLSAALAVVAIYERSFWLFCLATHLTGYYQATAGYYRFAAADTASVEFRPVAISWVLAGGLAAAIISPQLVIWTKNALEPVIFAGCFVAAVVVGLLAVSVVSFVRIPVIRTPGSVFRGGRPLGEILREPRMLAAMATGMVTYGMMSLVMTATPLAMVACGLTVDDAAGAIRWHILAMFAPSFFTGHLIARYGRERIIAAGLVMLAVCGVIALSGLTLANFSFAMILLGLGWNFGFIGATAMVTDCHTSEERGKVQAANDLAVFSFVAFSSFMSGKLLELIGWDGVNWTIFPFVLLALIVLTVLPRLSGAPLRPAE